MSQRAGCIVLALILLAGAGLLAHWIGRARETKARQECASNLKQLALAVHNHHDVYRSLPRGTVPNPNLPVEKRLSWLVAALPFLEGSRFYVDYDKAWDEGQNRVPQVGDMEETRKWLMGNSPLFLCPLNSSRAPEDRPGLTHYVGIAGVGENAPQLARQDRRCGVFGYDRKITFQDITDGRETTMLAVETMKDNGPWNAAGWPTLRGLVPPRRPYLGGEGQFSSRHAHRSGFATNVAFLDASVRPLTPTIADDVFEALATIAGGETVGSLPDE
jgi:hypothetical protein